MWVNQMQAAFVRAAVGLAKKPVVTSAQGRDIDQVVRVADRQRLRAPRENVQLSFRTAQKLKAEGAIQ